MKTTFVEEIELGSKNALIKLNILRYLINNGENTLPELGREMEVSVPTVTKLVGELIEDGFVIDFGKLDTPGGRKPNIYGLNPDSGCFLGVDVSKFQVKLAVINFKGELIAPIQDVDYRYENTEESFNILCGIISEYINSITIPKSQIISAGINLSGRVNTQTGHSYSLFYFSERSLSEIFSERLGLHVTIDNDSRAMTYGEYMNGVVNNEKNIFFINASWGLGFGIVIDGKLYYGKSGFSGEFGHIPVLDNEIICHCGKKGCLETEASGSYIHRRFIEKVNEGYNTILSDKVKENGNIKFEEILEAANRDDILAIELIEEVGNTLGRHIAGLINMFNPELIVIGGLLTKTGDYLLLPIRSAVKRYSLNMVSRDTQIKLSKLGDDAGVIGACLLARSKMLGIV